MSKPQATRYTPVQIAFLAYWESRGYIFEPGEMPPTSTLTPPVRKSKPRNIVRLVGIIMAVIVAFVYAALGFGLLWMHG